MHNVHQPQSRVFVALDVPTFEEAKKLVNELSTDAVLYKVGLQLLHTSGPKVLNMLQNEGKQVFIDAKFNDIPNTVHNAVTAISSFNPWGFTVHASGGKEMMKRAVLAVEKKRTLKASSSNDVSHDISPRVIAVTLLTSFDQESVTKELLVRESIETYTIHLANLAKQSGCNGIVCSGHEIKQIKQQTNGNLLTIVPGVRPSGMDSHDQRRVVTVTDAINKGADYIVIGRPILTSAKKRLALESILTEVSRCL